MAQATHRRTSRWRSRGAPSTHRPRQKRPTATSPSDGKSVLLKTQSQSLRATPMINCVWQMVLLGFCQWLSHLLIGMVKDFSVARVASAQFRGPTKQRASVLILVLIALLYGLEYLSFKRADMNWNGRTPGCQHPAVVSLSTGLQRTWQECVNHDQGLNDLWVKFHQRLKHMPTLRLSACRMHQDLHLLSRQRRPVSSSVPAVMIP